MIELRAQETFYAPGFRMSAHSDGCRRLSILTGGEQLESDPGRSERAGVGSVALKAPEFVHRNRFGIEGTTIVSVILPDDLLRRLGHEVTAVDRWRWHHGGTPSLLALRLALALKRADGRDTGRCVEGLLQAFRQATGPAISMRLRQIAEDLRRLPTRPVDTSRLAIDGRVHPGSLGRAFRRQYGCSMSRYRQRARVLAVARELLETRAPLSQIAFDHAFSDLSHMTRVFRRELGVPPGLFRRVLQRAARDLTAHTDEWRVSA